MALPTNGKGKRRAEESSPADKQKRKAPEERAGKDKPNARLENDRAGRKNSASDKKSKKSQKRPEHEMSAAERRELKEKQKKGKILIGSVAAAILVIAISVIILTVDIGRLFMGDSEGRDALEDGEQTIEGREELEDEGGAVQQSGADTDAGFPVELDEYLQQGFNSVENENAMGNFQSDWEDPNNWEPLEDNMEGGGYTWDDWDDECNAPVDNRRGSNFKNVEGSDQGWVYRDDAECNWSTGYIGDISTNWPSREMGYTNNPDLEVTEDGLNPLYSYVLREDVQWFFGHSLQKLLNPVYGGWLYYHQDTDNEMLLRSLSDVFTDDWWEENIENGSPSNLPIYADWNNDDYGGIEDIGEYGWFGEVTDAELDIDVDENGRSVTNGTLYIEYSALDGDSVITRDAELDIHIVPNQDDVYDVNNRMVIADAELRVSE